MIQVNLVPDIKADYLKAQSQKQLIVTIAVLASGGFIALVVLMFLYVNVIQAQHTNGLQDDIDAEVAKIQAIEDADKIVTVESQNAALEPIHLQKPIISRLDNFLATLTPNTATYDSVAIDITLSTVQLTGQAKDIKSVNTLVDTLKLAEYTTEGSDIVSPAFMNVILENVGSSDSESKVSTFDIQAVFDPLIFNASQDVTMTVPNITSTRSEAEKPKALFEPVQGDDL